MSGLFVKCAGEPSITTFVGNDAVKAWEKKEDDDAFDST